MHLQGPLLLTSALGVGASFLERGGVALFLLLSVLNAPHLQVMVAVTATSAVTPPMVAVMVVPMVVMSMVVMSMVVIFMLFSLSLHQKASGFSPLGPTRVLSVLSI